MRIPRREIYISIFFVLYIANTTMNHYVGTRYLEHAQEVQAIVQAGGDPTAVQLSEKVAGGAPAILVFNLPLFVTMGILARKEEPTMGLLYWLSLVIGAIYAPAIATGCTWLLLNAPQGPGLPGVDWEKKFDEEDDEDDRQ